eukprot:TRINITY_DN6743_c0_g1_i1.p2 TRINITY_DN6743_c0_g1~~TRINITY_DN6743_c0_g1_i1.p2  ORF type:complete len:151 (+),score=47.59 TRINITY_DN6743_c0_g1_i1:32-454(+)
MRLSVVAIALALLCLVLIAQCSIQQHFSKRDEPQPVDKKCSACFDFSQTMRIYSTRGATAEKAKSILEQQCQIFTIPELQEQCSDSLSIFDQVYAGVSQNSRSLAICRDIGRCTGSEDLDEETWNTNFQVSSITDADLGL